MRPLFFALMALVVASCAAVPIDTPAKRLAVAEVAFAEVVRQARHMVESGSIEPGTEREKVVTELILTGDMALDQAWGVLRVNPDDPKLSELLRSVSEITRNLRLELEKQSVYRNEPVTGDGNPDLALVFRFGGAGAYG